MAASSCEGRADTWLRSYRLPLVGFVLPLVNGDVQAAEDVVQETMLKGWQHAAELNPEHAGSWLHTVARNIAISTYHRRRRARPQEIPLDENTVPVADDGLDRIFDAWLVAKALNSAPMSPAPSARLRPTGWSGISGAVPPAGPSTKIWFPSATGSTGWVPRTACQPLTRRAIAEARRWAAFFVPRPQASFVVADAADTSLPAGTADALVCIDALQIVPDAGGLLLVATA